MTIEITGSPKEIAALILAVQERQSQSISLINNDGYKDTAMTAGT